MLSLILHVRRHYEPVDVVLGPERRWAHTDDPPTPGTITAPGLVVYRFGVGIFYANADRLSEEVLRTRRAATTRRAGSCSTPPRSTTSTTPAARHSSSSPRPAAGREIVVALCEVDQKVRAELDTFEITEKVGTEHIYETVQDALEAFQRAK